MSNIQIHDVRGTFFRNGDHKGFGERMKVSSEQAFIVRTIEDQQRKERAKKHAVPVMRELYANKFRHNRKVREKIALAIRELTVRMYGVRVDGFECYMSESALADYRANGIFPEIFAKPQGEDKEIQGRRINTRSIHNSVVEQQAASRANDHAMGIAQNAWRFAHLEGDTLAEKVAYYWLWHGHLRECHDSLCKVCAIDKRRRLQVRELTYYAFKYVDEEIYNATTHGTKKPHKMSKSPPKGFIGESKQIDSKVYEEAVKSGRLAKAS